MGSIAIVKNRKVIFQREIPSGGKLDLSIRVTERAIEEFLDPPFTIRIKT